MEEPKQVNRALTQLKRAVERAGGVDDVARRAGLARGHLLNVLCGWSGVARPTMARLQMANVRLPAATWMSLLAAPRPRREARP